MYPHERSLVKQLSDQPFALIGVNSDNDRESIQQIIKEKNITWRSFWNGPRGTSGPISTEWAVSSWPTIYVLDGQGKIRFINVRGKAMDRAIETLLAEAGHPTKIKHELDLDSSEEKAKTDDDQQSDDVEKKLDGDSLDGKNKNVDR